MSESAQTSRTAVKPAIFAAVFSLIGLIDSAYLTAKHFTDKNVPCNIISGCETVLKSEYAEFYGIPTAAFGAVAYFLALSLVILTIYGNSKLWNIFGALAAVMFLVTLGLIYLQAVVIGAFCQFCLLSALTSTALFVTFLVSKVFLKK